MKVIIEFEIGDITAGSASIVENELTYRESNWKALVTSDITFWQYYLSTTSLCLLFS